VREAEKELFIENIFSQKELFERHILNITCNSDRIEVMDILAKRIVRVLLKEELSFLYMKDLSNFKFTLVNNILFRELASEWVSYAEEKLGLNKEEALAVIQNKEHVLFVIELVKEYFEQYKIYFAQEIADSFIELVENMPNPNISNSLINEVLGSGFVKNKTISVVYSYSQLWARIRNAHSLKKDKLTTIQIDISECRDFTQRKKLEYKEESLEETPLAFFDEALQRLRNTMVTYMMRIDKFKE